LLTPTPVNHEGTKTHEENSVQEILRVCFVTFVASWLAGLSNQPSGRPAKAGRYIEC